MGWFGVFPRTGRNDLFVAPVNRDTNKNVATKCVRYSSVRSEEVPCFATYHFRTGSRPTVGQMFFRIKMN